MACPAGRHNRSVLCLRLGIKHVLSTPRETGWINLFEKQIQATPWRVSIFEIP
jgi:hypothetical protein